MKKIFETIGFISLVCFSFFYTNKISTVIKENDDILKQIKDVYDQYKIEPIDAKIIDNDIIPGVSGSSIDVDKSYDKMKKLNVFNTNLLVYESIKPNISINKVYDKYIISGNEAKKEVALIFLLNDNESIDNVLKIINKYNIKCNFFVDIDWFENNNDVITNLITNDHIVGSLLTDDTYLKSNINWMNAIVSKINTQENTYCYNNKKDNNFLDVCKLNNSYTIVPSLEAFDNPYIQIKKNVRNGSIISLQINDKTIEQLPLIIEYLNSKGFNIVSLSKLIEE